VEVEDRGTVEKVRVFNLIALPFSCLLKFVF
jgi:hypothetical protein